MGGRGSGYRWRSQRATCEASKRIDLMFLRKQGWLQPGRQYSLNWKRGDEPAGNISYIANACHMQLDYRCRNAGETEWQAITQTVLFDWTPLKFGGQRQWFRCPRCNRRCRILYGGAPFFCRKCHRLGYQTQAETPWQRQITRTQKIRERLGCFEGIDYPFPPKPKGMHWKTYHRLEAIDEHAQELWGRMAMAFIDRI